VEWQLVTYRGMRFFQFRWKRVTCLYSTKQGSDSFLRTFRPLTLKQVHSDTVVDIDVPHTGVGDGLLTRKTGVHLGIKVADCLPVYLFNKEQICIIHCGWRGIVNGIVQRAARFMNTYVYALGASIGRCCYEIQEDVAQIFKPAYGAAITHEDNKYFLDLKKAVIQDLGSERLTGSLDFCTKCHPEYFYSFRGGDRDERNCAVLFSGTALNVTDTAEAVVEDPA
jgi:YfiH family protein